MKGTLQGALKGALKRAEGRAPRRFMARTQKRALETTSAQEVNGNIEQETDFISRHQWRETMVSALLLSMEASRYHLWRLGLILERHWHRRIHLELSI